MASVKRAFGRCERNWQAVESERLGVGGLAETVKNSVRSGVKERRGVEEEVPDRRGRRQGSGGPFELKMSVRTSREAGGRRTCGEAREQASKQGNRTAEPKKLETLARAMRKQKKREWMAPLEGKD